jgi:seryl-tRNA synthetase
MLDPQIFRENSEIIRKMISDRGADLDLEEILILDQKRRGLQQKVDGLRNERNSRSKAIGTLKKQGQDISAVSQEVRHLGDELEVLEAEQNEVQEAMEQKLLYFPNIPEAGVPVGKTAQDNPVVRTWGQKPEFSFTPQDHVTLGENLGILDFERAAKISGARFAISFGLGARLERGLINFMLDLHTKDHGYQEVLPPYLVNRQAVTATGNLPKFEADLFQTKDPEFFLIPTAEVPVTNIHREEILAMEALPINYVAYTPCFRSEAGSYGQDTRGLIRQHQFNKVELVRFAHPERSQEELNILTGHAEQVLQKLGLHYRVVELCTGDLGFSSQKTYDLEVWLPSQKAYREISSCSNFGDFQARRAKIRFRPGGKEKPRFVHTLNGSGLAIGRTVVALLENYQQKDGTILIPEVLQPYMNQIQKISK